MADTSLIFNIIARDRSTLTMEKIKASAGSTGALVAKVLGPALVPVLGVANGAVLALGASFAAAGAGAGVFGAVAKSAMTEVTDAATKYEDLTAKIRLYGKEAQIQAARGEDNTKTLKKQSDAMLELEARMKLLPPETRRATENYLDLKEAWADFVDVNKPATFGIIANGLYALGEGIDHLQPLFDAGANAARRLVGVIAPLLTGPGIDSFAKRAGPALMSLTNIIINVGTAIGRSFGAFASDGQGMLDWLEKITRKWADWSDAKSPRGITQFVDYFHRQGPGVVDLLTKLAGAAVQIAKAVGPLAPISLAVATALASLIAAMPPGVITALVAAWIAYSAAIKVYAVGSAIMTAAQWAQNSAFLASPITWIVLAVVALAAGIIWLATKTRFFQTIWNAVWGFMKMVGAWFAGPFAGFFVMLGHKIAAFAQGAWHVVTWYFGLYKKVFDLVRGWGSAAVDWIKGKWNGLVGALTSAAGKISSKLHSMWDGMKAGFKSAINYVIGKWNSLHFSIPSFSVLGHQFGGGSIGVPSIPYMATGGRIRSDGLIFAHAGEEVTKKAQVTRTGRGAGSGGSSSGATITINGSNSKAVRVLLELLREGIRDQGGDVVKVLTPR